MIVYFLLGSNYSVNRAALLFHIYTCITVIPTLFVRGCQMKQNVDRKIIRQKSEYTECPKYLFFFVEKQA